MSAIPTRPNLNIRNDANQIADIEYALGFIPNEDREIWLEVGMALHAELGETGFTIWDDWSCTFPKYKKTDAHTTWRSFKAGSITIATLFHHAKSYGWKPKNGIHQIPPLDEKKRLKRLQEAAQAEQEQQMSQAAIAKKCAIRWAQASPADDRHPYLLAKGCKPYGIRQETDKLLIPMQDSDGNLWSLQTIDPGGGKLFAKGGRAKGLYFRIEGTGPVVICEGYATGATIHEATGYNVTITFSCGNLEAVATTIRSRLPDTRIIVAADSAPASTTEKARAVAAAIGADLAIPNVDSDFNDLYQAEGLDMVKAQIDAAARAKKQKADMAWIQSFTVTEQEVEEMSDPEWVYENLIIQGHILVIPAPANGGKTTIMQYVCAQISDSYEVYYVNADISGGDAKWAHAHAQRHGYTLMLPDMKTGLSMDDVVEQLLRMNMTDADYTGIVFIFDTLKKMTDVISKSKAKELYKVLRGLTAKGMTVALLAHTNKYKDVDGNYIFEGTGDLRTDVDDMIYMVPKKNDDGSMTVSTNPDKVRGAFKPITFSISATRHVTALDTFVDVATIKQAEAQREKDETVIEAITEAIENGKIKQTEITSYCGDNYNIGWRTVDKVLNRYRRPPLKKWTRTKGFQKNAWLYKLEARNPLPQIQW